MTSTHFDPEINIKKKKGKLKRIFVVVNLTFDVVLFDCRAAVRRFLHVGSVALFVDDAPTCSGIGLV